jgi:hypothetical protein
LLLLKEFLEHAAGVERECSREPRPSGRGDWWKWIESAGQPVAMREEAWIPPTSGNRVLFMVR